jgi:hypothetical protein
MAALSLQKPNLAASGSRRGIEVPVSIPKGDLEIRALSVTNPKMTSDSLYAVPLVRTSPTRRTGIQQVLVLHLINSIRGTCPTRDRQDRAFAASRLSSMRTTCPRLLS